MRKTQKISGTLKLQRGKFILENVEDPKVRVRLRLNAHWENIGNDSYRTSDLGAANAYRNWGDEKVERIFKKTFQEFYSFPICELPPELDDHQVQGLHWILTRKRSYLAHAPGAGKTVQAILGAYYSEGLGRSLFIVPPSLTKNWEREIMKFTEWVGEWPAIGVIGQADSLGKIAWGADYIICPDSMLAKPWVAKMLREIKWKFIAVDEASRLKDPFSQRSLAFYGGKDEKNSFTPLFRGARHVVFLDGSPMPNRPMELWAPTYALHPEAIDCMGYDDFGYRYCGARPNERGQWEYLYSSHEQELKEKIQKDFMHVVTEGELDHPERRRSLFFISHDVRSREHKDWEARNIGHIDLSDSTSQGDLARFRRELGLRKVPYVAQYVRERLEEKNESILLFAWHRDVCAQLAVEFTKYPFGLINGGVDVKKREQLIKEFQCGKRRLLIMNIAAGGRGYNLQRADRVIFAEFSWTDETNKQAEKRASRKGSDKKNIRCEYMVAPGSMDEVVLRSVFTKEKRVKKVIG